MNIGKFCPLEVPNTYIHILFLLLSCATVSATTGSTSSLVSGERRVRWDRVYGTSFDQVGPNVIECSWTNLAKWWSFCCVKLQKAPKGPPNEGPSKSALRLSFCSFPLLVPMKRLFCRQLSLPKTCVSFIKMSSSLQKCLILFVASVVKKPTMIRVTLLGGRVLSEWPLWRLLKVGPVLFPSDSDLKFSLCCGPSGIVTRHFPYRPPNPRKYKTQKSGDSKVAFGLPASVTQ